MTEVTQNLITGTRDGVNSSRDRGDWKKVHERPAHLIPEAAAHVPAHTRLPTIYKNVFEEGELSEEEEDQPSQQRKPATRAATRQQAAPPRPAPPPAAPATPLPAPATPPPVPAPPYPGS